MAAVTHLVDVPLLQEVLQHLSTADLGSLAQTCRALRDLVNSAGVDIWRKVTAAVIGPSCPAIKDNLAGSGTVSAETLQAALQRHSRACHTLASGVHTAGKSTSAAWLLSSS